MAVVFAILAIAFYVEAKREPRLSCFVKPIRSILARQDRFSDVRLFYHGSELSGSVSGLELVIWNDGNHSIQGSDILEPVVLRMSDGSRILDSRIIRVTRRLIGTKLKSTPDGGGIVVDWRILEERDGATIQIVYAGGPEVDVLVAGAIKGQRRIARLEAPEGPIYRTGFNRSRRRVTEVFLIWIALMSVFALYMMWGWRGDSKISRIAGTLLLLFCIVIMVREALYGYVEPPFGFLNRDSAPPVARPSSPLKIDSLDEGRGWGGGEARQFGSPERSRSSRQALARPSRSRSDLCPSVPLRPASF